MYDLVVRGGTVIDGSGSAGIRADVGVRNGRIVEVGRIGGRGREEVDAEGHVVSPGFVDGHTHMDAQVFWDELGTSSCWQGVTTVVMGHCGFTLAPARADRRELVVRNLERAEDISPVAMAEGIRWSWETFPEYLDAVDRLPKGINYAANLGHSALRTWVMGERAFEAEASDDELDEMARVLREALEAGAMGFTTTRNTFHQTSDGRPVASRLASWAEVVRLVSEMADAGAGIFQITGERAANSPDPEVRAEYYDRLGALAVATGVPFTFGVPASPTGLAALDFIDTAVAEGARIFGMAHSRGVASVLSFETQLPFDRLAAWKEFRTLPLEEQARRLRDPATRAPLLEAAKHGDYGSELVGAEVRPPEYDNMFVMDRPMPPYSTVAALAEAAGVHPAERLIDLALERDLKVFFIQPIFRFTDENTVRVMKHPRTVMTFSDSGAHVSQVADSSIQTHLLSYWVRERQAFTLEEAVRMVTYDPATAWGFYDRGLVREGFVADLNVFDPATVAPEMPELVYDLPGGARRLTQRARGYRATVVGGTVTLRDGEHTGARPGRLLRRGAHRQP